MTERQVCGSCGHTELYLVLDLGTSPLADKFPSSPDEREASYPLCLLQCTGCQLVQLQHIVPDDELWDDYGFFSSTSPGIVAYHQEFANWLRSQFGVPDLVIEIACNDGSLLSKIDAKRRVGVDAAAGPVKAAQRQGLDVRHALFNEQVALNLVQEVGHADVIVAQNVVAHVTDLNRFLSGIRILLSKHGVAIIEAQDLQDLLLGNMFDHVYHEHRFFFSPSSLVQAIRQAGMAPVSVTRTPMQGGSIRVICQRLDRSFADPMSPLAVDLTGLQARAEYLRRRILDELDSALRHGSVAGWAASAKSATLLNWCSITAEQVQYIEDTTPAKLGKYTPGTHIPIVAPGRYPYPDTFLLLAHNYVNRIRRDAFPGRWLVPIPYPVVL